MSADTKGPRVIRCPGCFGPSIYSTDNAFRPFCSVRCKNADFGAWASEGYRVAAGIAADDTDESAAPPPH